MKPQHAMLLWTLATVGVIEMLVMFILPRFDLPGGLVKTLLDTGLLLAICTPLLYAYYKKARKAVDEANEKLATRVNELEQHTRETILLNEMGELLLAAQSPEEAYTIIAQFAKGLFPAASGALCVIGASRNLVDAVATWGESGMGERVFAPNECWALRPGRLHWVEDAPSGLLYRHVSHHAAPAVYLCVPMMADGEALGLRLQICPQGLNQPQEPQEGLRESRQRLAVAVAEHIALALANLNLREILRTQSIDDPLTGLFNRRYMEKFLERELARAARKERPLG